MNHNNSGEDEEAKMLSFIMAARHYGVTPHIPDVLADREHEVYTKSVRDEVIGCVSQAGTTSISLPTSIPGLSVDEPSSMREYRAYLPRVRLDEDLVCQVAAEMMERNEMEREASKIADHDTLDSDEWRLTANAIPSNDHATPTTDINGVVLFWTEKLEELMAAVTDDRPTLPSVALRDHAQFLVNVRRITRCRCHMPSCPCCVMRRVIIKM